MRLQNPTSPSENFLQSTIELRAPVAEDALALHELIANSPPLDPNSLYCNLLHCTHFSATSVAAFMIPAASSEVSAEQARDSAASSPSEHDEDRSSSPEADCLCGFISAYIPPAQPDTLFVWQVAVADVARSQGLAQRMLDVLLERPQCRAVRYLETTITPNNQPSWALFRAWARRHRAAFSDRLHFDRERHLGGRHDSEFLVRIGPLALAGEAAT